MRELESLSDLEDALEQEKPVFLFKHSTRCPVSTLADNNYNSFVEDCDDSKVLLTHLNLIEHRDVSNAIADKTGVAHQSPQAILIVNGQAVWNASHTLITVEALKQAVEDHCS